MTFWCPPFSLLSKAYLPTKNQHQPWDPHEPHSQQQTGPGPAQQRACPSLRTPLTLQPAAPGPGPTHQWVSSRCTRLVQGSHRAGAALSTSIPTIVGPTTTEGPTQLT